ncbi:unnamed protein product, partial [Onchocerca ochengi]
RLLKGLLFMTSKEVYGGFGLELEIDRRKDSINRSVVNQLQSFTPFPSIILSFLSVEQHFIDNNCSFESFESKVIFPDLSVIESHHFLGISTVYLTSDLSSPNRFINGASYPS